MPGGIEESHLVAKINQGNAARVGESPRLEYIRKCLQPNILANETNSLDLE
jgi:hypothetical protein